MTRVSVVWLHWLTDMHHCLTGPIPLQSDHTCYLGLNAISCCDVNLTNHAEQKQAATADSQSDKKQKMQMFGRRDGEETERVSIKKKRAICSATADRHTIGHSALH